MVSGEITHATPRETDIFVIGGGPAGLAAAIAARQRGFRVVVADGAQPPIDKACGEGLMPDSLAALARLGIQLSLSDAHPFRGIRFLSGALSANAHFPAGGCGLAVRRISLHRLMMERAAHLGVELLWRAAVTGMSAEGVQVGKHLVRARWIIGADGSDSRVRRWTRIDSNSRARLRYAFRRHFRVAPWTDHMEVYWGDRCQGYATAVSSEQVCVALASPDPNLRLEDGLRQLPELRARLSEAETVSTERGALTGNRTFRRVWRGNVALIGDASGTVDAITGDGLGLAFSQAVALAESLKSGNLARYQIEHRRLMLRPRYMARLMLTLDGRPRLQRRTLQVFQKRPEVFRRLLELHVGALSPLHVALDGLTLGWGLLTA
jgi:flavin-dependent dehydrogenase